jgi:DNA repair photolyase
MACMESKRTAQGQRGRGAASNPPNRFALVSHEVDEDWLAYEGRDAVRLPTQYLEDASKSVLSRNTSPDVGFDVSLNPYRGCEHGCAYCYARPTHEYLSFSAGIDFETKILVKRHAPALLREELLARSWKPQPIAMSGVTDCYQPIERDLRITRGCLEVLEEFRNPVSIITKNRLVTRDLDILARMAAYRGVRVNLSVTTLDLDLNRILEPRTSSPAQRLDTIRRLNEAGIAVGVLVAPVIPGITDMEIPAILQAAGDAGACSASYVMLRLPHAVAPLFEQWLDLHFPDRKEKVLNRLRSLRGGKVYDATFGTRMRGEGVYADEAERLFAVARKKAGIPASGPELNTNAFRRAEPGQLHLFD